MKQFLHFGAVSVFALLAACGGGSGSSDSSSTGSGNGATTLPAMLISASSPDTFATIAVNTPEGMLQIGHYAHSVAIEQQAIFGSLHTCRNGGARTTNLTGGLPLKLGRIL